MRRLKPIPRRTPLTPVGELRAFEVILRAIHERGAVQLAALNELHRRGLWLSPEQIAQADAAWFYDPAAAWNERPVRYDVDGRAYN